ncbi:hypothetical protein LIER_02699 [Lithospermum erythrorhizon]|uniref:RNase H type-1 domain-containing protein n=1 Tax=Lithospermum erythrorhizon TaxID=34254 RepID=A0AAV3NV16_LITER
MRGGEFRGAAFKQIQHVGSALVAEALAIREGLHFAWGRGFRCLEMESDSKQLVSSLRGEWSCPAEVEVVVADIMHLTRYMKVKFQYVKRGINNATHCVAHWDHRGVMEAHWLVSPPDWLRLALT